MLIRLGNSIVESDEILAAKIRGDDMTIEVIFKSHGKVFTRHERLIVDSDNPKADLDAYLKCLVS